MTDDDAADKTATTDASTLITRATAELTAGVSITFTPAHESQRRIQYEPRPDADGWWRITHEWTGCTWRIVGREPLAGPPSLSTDE